MAELGDLDVHVLFPSEFLRAEDLKGRAITVTFTGASLDDVPMTGGKKKAGALVLTMAKTRKKFLVGKTNARSLGVLLSPKPRDWVGKRATLIADLDYLKKELVPAIRIQGSPDATPERAKVYAEAWKGERKRGALCSRLKRALSLLEMGAPPPVEPELPDAEEAPEAAPAEPDLFDEETDKPKEQHE